jgi:hypothetical protein
MIADEGEVASWWWRSSSSSSTCSPGGKRYDIRRSDSMRSRGVAGGLSWLLAAGLLTAPGSVRAASHKRGNLLERHPVMTGVGAAAAAHHMGKNRLRHGRRPNFAERHPVMTGVAAGATAHHMAKKHH